mmetsp:Transcript_58498/g.165251  ORF Transcript_58498/g.165251 Transcript_58498/m.165251 type:complete len:228 (+) Transcript_58498:115-798(+)
MLCTGSAAGQVSRRRRGAAWAGNTSGHERQHLGPGGWAWPSISGGIRKTHCRHCASPVRAARRRGGLVRLHHVLVVAAVLVAPRLLVAVLVLLLALTLYRSVAEEVEKGAQLEERLRLPGRVVVELRPPAEVLLLDDPREVEPVEEALQERGGWRQPREPQAVGYDLRLAEHLDLEAVDLRLADEAGEDGLQPGDGFGDLLLVFLQAGAQQRRHEAADRSHGLEFRL